jgi:hypothetical protein
MTATYTTVAKKTGRGQTRIWLEGDRLTAHGFAPLTVYRIDHFAGRIICTVDPKGPRKVTNSVRAGKSRPIIDLHSKAVTEAISPGSNVEVTFETGVITITQIV